jgi:hypothetical protein
MTSATRDDSPVVYMFHKGVMGLPWMAKNPRSIDVLEADGISGGPGPALPGPARP